MCERGKKRGGGLENGMELGGFFIFFSKNSREDLYMRIFFDEGL